MPWLPRSRHETTDESAEDVGIPLAPLVDIVFLLLIFFLVATTYMDEEKDLTLVLPRAQADGSAGARLQRVLLNVRADGTILVGDRSVSRQALYAQLVEARRANPAVPVILRGDRSTSHGEIVGVLSICQRARIRNVAVAVEHPRRAEEAPKSREP